MKNTFKQLDITKSTIQRRCLNVNVQEAGGRQGRLCAYRKAAAPLKKLRNLAWGL